MTVPSLTTSGFVAATPPRARRVSGVVKTSSLGRFEKCRKPFAVEKSTADQVAVGSRPIVSSVPGPRQPSGVVAQHAHALAPAPPAIEQAIVCQGRVYESEAGVAEDARRVPRLHDEHRARYARAPARHEL